MDVAESPERGARSPEGDEEQQGLSDDDILRGSGSDQDADGAGEDEERAAGAPGPEEDPSDEEDGASEAKSQDQDSEGNALSRGPAHSPCEGEGEDGEEERTSDLRDEASSVTRELDEHELDYDEEVPEEPEKESERAAAEEEEEGKAGAPEAAGPEPPEAGADKRKGQDDGEIDDGEIEDDDLEEGEVKDPSDRKVRPRPTCRFFMKGNCTWGVNCRFIHPGVNDKGNYSLLTKAEPFPPNGAPPLGPHPLMPANPWGGPAVEEILPPPPPEPPTESAWERGLRHAKEVLKKATIRKEQEPDFEEKRFTVTIGEDEREFDKENEVFRDWNARVPRDVRDPAMEPYADPYYDYEVERFWRGGQYENFRVQYTEAEPYHSYRERERDRERENRQRERERERERERRQRERERERERDKERQRRKEEWERERAKREEKDRRDRDRDKERERPKPRSPQPPSRPAEPPRKEAAAPGPQVKRADEWKDPWRRSKSPKKKLGVSVSPSRARRRRKTSASSASASNSSRSSSRSSSYSGSGSSRSRSRSSSYSSYSSRSSRHSSFSGSRSRSRSFSSSPSPSPTPSPHRPSVRAKGEPALPPGRAGEKSVKKPASAPAAPQATKTTALAPEPSKGDPREVRRKERQARTPPRRRTLSGSGSGSSYSGSSSRSRSLSVSSVSSVSSATSSSSSVHSVDSEDMYADLASPVSSASSRSPTPAQTKKEKGKSKREDAAKEDKRKKDSTQPAKSTRAPAGGKASQASTAPQQAAPGQCAQGAFVAHKEIKLTLLNKAADRGSRKRYEPSDKERQSPPAKRANLSPERGARDRKSGGRPGSPKAERQRGQNARAPAAPADRKRQLSPQSKSSSKVTSVPGRASEAGAGSKSGKASTLSRREELLKQLKAVEDAIARKRAKIPGKV
ncbi:zinc finger CCCH domain-containing protein 18 isoform X2 [Ochotona princeps]|uniref:zinc finger CCCH domain-containing protein 18 isoform X2 n=1 Tax=Ochotona princeps TaxID=9978 RepID=UPI002714BD39|nr:zinc finger CCCH domain-containing protein 18 isoform X2 [Ochotona princeps]